MPGFTVGEFDATPLGGTVVTCGAAVPCGAGLAGRPGFGVIYTYIGIVRTIVRMVVCTTGVNAARRVARGLGGWRGRDDDVAAATALLEAGCGVTNDDAAPRGALPFMAKNIATAKALTQKTRDSALVSLRGAIRIDSSTAID